MSPISQMRKPEAPRRGKELATVLAGLDIRPRLVRTQTPNPVFSFRDSKI